MDKILHATEKAKVNLENLRLKEIIQNAQQDLSSSWKALSEKAKKEAKQVNRKARKALATEDGGSLRDSYILTVNLDAGYDLCQKYQKDWATMHQESVVIVQKAELVDDAIFKLAKDWSVQNENLDDFQHNLRSLAELVKNVETARGQLGSISDMMQKIEEMICDYEDTCERLTIQQNKQTQRVKLSELVEKKHQEYTAFKASLESQAAMKEEAKKQGAVRRFSFDRQNSVEKQQAYRDAFLDQMNQYITHGRLEDPIAGSAALTTEESRAKLEEVKFEESDLKALKEFLGPEELNSVLKAQALLATTAASSEHAAHNLNVNLDSAIVGNPGSAADTELGGGHGADGSAHAPLASAFVAISETVSDEAGIVTPLQNCDDLSVSSKPARKHSDLSDEDGEYFDAASDSEAT